MKPYGGKKLSPWDVTRKGLRRIRRGIKGWVDVDLQATTRAREKARGEREIEEWQERDGDEDDRD